MEDTSVSLLSQTSGNTCEFWNELSPQTQWEEEDLVPLSPSFIFLVESIDTVMEDLKTSHKRTHKRSNQDIF